MTVDRGAARPGNVPSRLRLADRELLATGQMVKYMTPALDPLSAATGALLAAMAVAEILAVARRSGGGAALPPRAPSEQAIGMAAPRSEPRWGPSGRGRPGQPPRPVRGRPRHSWGRGDRAGADLAARPGPVVLGLVVTPRALGSGALGGEQVDRLLLTFATGDDAGRSAGALASAAEVPLDDLGALLAHLRRLGEGGVGQRVRVTGMAARSDALAPNRLALLRYAIAHCVADARPLALLVVGAGALDLAEDQWVEVEASWRSVSARATASWPSSPSASRRSTSRSIRTSTRASDGPCGSTDADGRTGRPARGSTSKCA